MARPRPPASAGQPSPARPPLRRRSVRRTTAPTDAATRARGATPSGGGAGTPAAPAAGPDTSGAARVGALGRLRARPAILVLLASLAVLGLLYAGALVALRPAAPGNEVRLDTVFAAASAREVKSARLLDEDARITGVIERLGEDPREFWTAYPRSDAATNDLLKALLGAGTEVTVDAQAGKGLIRFLAQFLLPLVILANLFALLFYLVRGSGAPGADDFVTFSQLGDRRLEGGRQTTFADMAAADEVVAELAEIRDYLDSPAAFERMGALPPKGVLLVGPPGCGKTLMARAVAGEAKATFFSISGSEFVESLVGVGAARVRDLFRQAKAAAPAIIFIDELDAVGRQRGTGLGGGHDEREQTLNELLVQMDGFSPAWGVAVLAATNRVDILDPALLRPGRFDRHITIERPDKEGRLSILRLHAGSKRLAEPERDLADVARLTPGFTGADLANVLNEAALLAVRDRSTSIARHHLDEAVERMVAGPKRKGVLLSVEDKRRIACHESGHAVVAAALGRAAAVERVSIVARGRGIGHLALLAGEQLLPTRSEMEAQIAIAMGGAAAEQLVLGEPSTGSEADLVRATNTARDMAGRYGMSPRVGSVRVLHDEREVFLGRDYLSTRDVSQPTLEHLDAEVRRMVEEQESRARAILTANAKAFGALANALAAEETVQGPRLAALLAGVVPHRSPAGTPPVSANPSPNHARPAPTSGVPPTVFP